MLNSLTWGCCCVLSLLIHLIVMDMCCGRQTKWNKNKRKLKRSLELSGELNALYLKRNIISLTDENRMQHWKSSFRTVPFRSMLFVYLITFSLGYCRYARYLCMQYFFSFVFSSGHNTIRWWMFTYIVASNRSDDHAFNKNKKTTTTTNSHRHKTTKHFTHLN